MAIVISDFGMFLRRTRKLAGLTLKELERETGISYSYLSQLETGARSIPSPEILQKLAEPLSVGYVQLMQEAGYLAKPSDPLSPLIPRNSLEFAFANIARGIDRILEDIVKNEPNDEPRVRQFRATLRNVLHDDYASVNDLLAQLTDVEPDGDMFPSFGTMDQHEHLELLLHLLQKVKDDDYAREEVTKKLIYSLEISHYLTEPDITYNGHRLTDQDKQRISDVLRALFPNYQQPPTTDSN